MQLIDIEIVPVSGFITFFGKMQWLALLILQFLGTLFLMQEKYQVAAQNTLNACYRECLQLLAESELKTVAIPCFWYSRLILSRLNRYTATLLKFKTDTKNE